MGIVAGIRGSVTNHPLKKRYSGTSRRNMATACATRFPHRRARCGCTEARRGARCCMPTFASECLGIRTSVRRDFPASRHRTRCYGFAPKQTETWKNVISRRRQAQRAALSASSRRRSAADFLRRTASRPYTPAAHAVRRTIVRLPADTAFGVTPTERLAVGP